MGTAVLAVIVLTIVLMQFWPNISERLAQNAAVQTLGTRNYARLIDLAHPAEIQLCGWTDKQTEGLFRDLELSRTWRAETSEQLQIVREGTKRRHSVVPLNCEGCERMTLNLARQGNDWKVQLGALAYDAALATHGIPEGNQKLVEAMREHDIECIVHGPRRLIATPDMLAEKPNDPDAAWQPITKPLPE
ncbi:MAG: hypothetical protein ACOCX1_03470 [Fimbriimonadaceae bacterium]